MSRYGPLLDALRGVRWPARRTVGASLPGSHRSTQRGTAGEFTEYRLYRQGDDPRALDWNLLGRSDRAFVRLSDDRALLRTWFVVDASASMRYPLGEAARDKWQCACHLTVGLAAVAHASSDPVGLLVAHGDAVTRVPPRTRRGTVQELSRVLDAVTPTGAAALAPLLAQVEPTARVVLVTDCLGDHDALLRAGAALAVTGAQLECVHVVAREELELPRGTFLARDPEGGDEGRVLSSRDIATYRTAFEAFRAQVQQAWRALGAGYTLVTTDADASRAVRAVVAGAGRADGESADRRGR
jgi:uncharacterized protein (DUF58 family)